MGHHHSHSPKADRIGLSLTVGIALNGLFVAVEAAAGLMLGSLGLITDAGHNLGDVASLALSLIAFRLARRKSNERYTYGYRRATIHVALINGVILLVAVGAIGWEAAHRLFNPQPVAGGAVALVALAGILVNSATAFLFSRDKERDLNVKSAYLHMAADAAVSAGVLVGGLAILFTGWFWIDSAISFLVIALIVKNTWGLLQDSVRLSLDAVPKGIDVPAIRAGLCAISGVAEVRHIHIWPLSTTETALTAHVVVTDAGDIARTEAIKASIRQTLLQSNIQHATLEIDSAGSEAGCRGFTE